MSEAQKELILKEIQKYKADSSSYKPLFQSMKDISLWLETKGQS